MASMYDPIKDYLLQAIRDSETLTFEKINELIKCRMPEKALPKTAYNRKEWWSNDTVSHTQSVAWLSAGWKVKWSEIKLGVSITFVRDNHG